MLSLRNLKEIDLAALCDHQTSRCWPGKQIGSWIQSKGDESRRDLLCGKPKASGSQLQ